MTAHVTLWCNQPNKRDGGTCITSFSGDPELNSAEVRELARTYGWRTTTGLSPDTCPKHDDTKKAR